MDRILELRNANVSYQEIAEELGTTKGNISSIISKMKRQGYEIIKIKPWTEEEELKLLELRNQHKNNKEIAIILNKSHDSVKKKASEFLQLGIIEGTTRKGIGGGCGVRLNLPKDELIEIVRKYVSSEACPTHLRSNIKRVFGSWTKALEAAGISGNVGGNFIRDKLTTLYFVDFGDFQKIGITQQRIKSRLSGAPPYNILDYLETDLDNAIYFEKELKKVIQQYIPEHHWFERNGKTECFRTNCKTFEELLAPKL